MTRRMNGAAVIAIAVAGAGVCLAACTAPAREVPLSPEQIPAALVELTQAPNRTMHMVWSGTYAMGGRKEGTSQFSGSFDFAGDDYAGLMRTRGTDTEIAVVDGQAYQSSDARPVWEKVSTPTRTLDPLHGLRIGDVEYVGREAVDGADRNHLRVTDLSNVINLMMESHGGGVPFELVAFDKDHSSLDVYVDDDARPVSAALNLSNDANPDDFGTLSLRSTYEFSNWGAEIDIVPPP